MRERRSACERTSWEWQFQRPAILPAYRQRMWLYDRERIKRYAFYRQRGGEKHWKGAALWDREAERQVEGIGAYCLGGQRLCIAQRWSFLRYC